MEAVSYRTYFVMGLGALFLCFIGGIILLHLSDSEVRAEVILNRRPNIVYILTDDQDVTQGGMTPMVKARKLLGDNGVTFQNMFVNTPLCCPSRASILTGKYIHNHGTRNNSISGNCSSPIWQRTQEVDGFVTYLKKQNYKTFFAGKYLNQYGKKIAGGVQHVPPGWDWWTGLVGNSVYYNYRLSVNGTKEKHGGVYEHDYLTDLIGKQAQDFLQLQNAADPFFMMLSTPACHGPFTPAPQYSNNFENVKPPQGGSYNVPGKGRKAMDFLGFQHKDDQDPFFMMLSTPACHEPDTPAPQYKNAFRNVTAPKGGSYNLHAQDKHWLVRNAPNPLSKESVEFLESTFVNRWRTLLSVDDIVENVVNVLTEKNLLDNTYIFLTSDNGFHSGQFSLPNDKRQLYEFDIRVPLLVRGPHISPNTVKKQPALNIDLAPTFIELAGLRPPIQMDGVSLVPLLLQNTYEWPRDTMLIEHFGESVGYVSGCPHLNNQDVANCHPDCVCEDSKNNTYACIRTVNDQENTIYCEMKDSENFIEYYDLTADPYQLKNIAYTADPRLIKKKRHMLRKMTRCSGSSCVRPSHKYEYNYQR